jgi:peptidoglycan/LPS O-acetylase OafA/YrhL
MLPTMPVTSRPTGIRAGSTYWASLDGVRGLFMLTIFLYHADTTLVPGAGISVDAFFVMSAFLITVLLVREHERTGRIDLVGFYRRRVLRLFPAMLVVVPVAAVAAYALIPERRSDVLPSVLSVLFYFANFRAASEHGMAVFLPTWSLSTEEQFYVVWSSLLLLVFALRVRPRALVATVGVLCVLAAGWLQVAYEQGTPLRELSYRPDLRVIGILIGTLVGLVHAFELVDDRARPFVRSVAVAGTAFVAYYLFRPLTLPKDTIVTLAIVAACVVFGALVLQQVRWPLAPYSWVLDSRVLVWVGRRSYVLYLLHVPVIRCMTALVGVRSPTFRIVVDGAIVLALAWVVHEYVEKPALRLKERTSPVPAELR